MILARRHAGLLLVCSLGLLLAFTISCGRQQGDGGADDSAASGATGVYDPALDPLVNPDSMFEPLPEDPSQVAGNETLVRVVNGNPGTLNPLFSSSLWWFHSLPLHP